MVRQLLGKCRNAAISSDAALKSIQLFFDGPLIAFHSVELLKIERISRPGCTAIKLTGRLDGEFLPELAPQIPADGRGIVLEMDELRLVDGDAVRFLIDCESRGIQLRGCSAYIREWITRERESDK
ncbi:MAG: hypothetical protein JO121_27395 [Deltaproteobacteria bacterium]|nr:hypothetical protein [Deltaproteobacteria bacterium]